MEKADPFVQVKQFLQSQLKNATAQNKNQILAQLEHLDAAERCSIPIISKRCNLGNEIVEIVRNTASGDKLLTIWLQQLIGKEELSELNEQQWNDLMHWLQTSIEDYEKNAIAAAVGNAVPSATPAALLRCMNGLMKSHIQYADKYLELLFHPDRNGATFLRYLKLKNEHPAELQLDEEVVIALISCADTLLSGLITTETTLQLNASQTQACEILADALLQQHYADVWTKSETATAVTLFLLHSLTLLQKLASLCPTYTQTHASELLGLTRAYVQFGKEQQQRAAAVLPQKVHISQQSLYDAGEESSDNGTVARQLAGGKISKTRKPRTVNRGGKRQQQHLDPTSISSHTTTSSFSTLVDSNRALLLDSEILIKTSDSEFSESDAFASAAINRLVHEQRHRSSQIRLAAINLLGTVARQLERRKLYGYWHAFFPSDNVSGETSLLQIGRNDTNVRCRSAALQVAAQLLFISKPFLRQAESDKRNQLVAAFVPFAINLGASVICMYETLTVILEQEASLPVLTQALKCLAVLIQATPFEQLQLGFVRPFVGFVKPLTQHRDSTIQVSALMVMEFLVATPVWTTEIAEIVGLAPALLLKSKTQLPEAADDENEQLLEDEFEEEEIFNNYINKTEIKEAQIVSPAENAQQTSSGWSWLLRRIIQNLCYDEERVARLPTTPVRVESLQLLVALSSHFNLLSGHLSHVANALRKSLDDPLTDVRLYAGRCLDAIAYQMSRHLLELQTHQNNINHNNVEINECSEFWMQMLPHIYAAHQHQRQTKLPTLKVSLCDALSNIGVVMYERLPHGYQCGILAFLSGNSSEETEDVNVRAAAVRALAVFVLFPSLRQDLVFVENTAELSLRLSSDANLNVRIKALWSLGNISDALISRQLAYEAQIEEENNRSNNQTIPNENLCLPSTQERFADDLLRRLIGTATDACSDNDKVRSNAVRTLGNLLRLISESQLSDCVCRQMFQRAIGKLIDCIRTAGNAKVKWNACYAISSLMRNHALHNATSAYADLVWKSSLFPALCHVIVHHANFKVRINATSAILNIECRAYFGEYFEMFWSALLVAIEQSYNLDNFFEYNHRDNLQEQLCLAIAHMLSCATLRDYAALCVQLTERLEVVHNTWTRVTNRMVPERAAPLLACVAHLQTQLENGALSREQQYAIECITNAFAAQ